MGDQHTTNAAADEADRLLTFLNVCEDDRHPWAAPIRNMDGALPFSWAFASQGINKGYMRNDGAPAIWPVDMKTVEPAGAATDIILPEGSWSFDRVRTCAMSEARKLGYARFSRTMVMREEVFALPDGTTKSFCMPFCRLAGSWVWAGAQGDGPAKGGAFIEAMLGMALALRYSWTVWLGYGEGPRIRFLTDPLGAREAFRMRDLPPGRERRTALRHWVSEHWRRQPRAVDPSDNIWIEKHMRGATDFVWNELRCRIQPPEYDIEMLAPRKEAINAS